MTSTSTPSAHPAPTTDSNPEKDPAWTWPGPDAALAKNRAQLAILVTGASAGLGRAAAIALAERGHVVVGAARDGAALESAAREAAALAAKRGTPGLLVPLVMDVSVAESVRDAAQRLRRFATGPEPCLDAVVNFSGVTRVGSCVEMDDAAMATVLNTNVLGTFHVNKYFAPLLRRERPSRAGPARIVNVASEISRARFVSAFNAPYTVSKIAVEAYSVALRAELGTLRPPVAVVVLQPGAYTTELADSLAPSFQAESERPGTAFRVPLALSAATTKDYVAKYSRPAQDLAAVVVRILETPRPPRELGANVSLLMRVARWVPQTMLDRTFWDGVKAAEAKEGADAEAKAGTRA